MKFSQTTFFLSASLSLIGIPLTSFSPLSATTNIIGERKVCSSFKTEVNTDKALNKYSKNSVNFNYEEAITIETVGARILAKFSPQKTWGSKIELKKLASVMGYDHFNWVSYVEEDPHGIADKYGRFLSTPYNDPPQGGYYYEAADEFPFYWDIVKCDRCRSRHHYHNPKITNKFELVFEDVPADYRLKRGESIQFTTHLVGVKSLNFQTKQATWDVLKTFKWKLSNPIPGKGKVSLVKENLDSASLSNSVLTQMQADGAIIPNLSAGVSCNLSITKND